MLLMCVVLGSSEILSAIQHHFCFLRRRVTAVLLVHYFSNSNFVIKYFLSVVEVLLSQLFGKPVKHHQAGEYHHTCYASGELCVPAGDLSPE